MKKSGRMMRGGITCIGKRRTKKTLRKINRLLKDIDRNGYNCTGKPEPLKYLPGYWSVRIDDKNRIVFRIVNECVEIAECGSHYGDH